MICYRCANVIQLCPQICVYVQKIQRPIVICFCIMRWLASYGIIFSFVRAFMGLPIYFLRVSPLLDIVVLGGIKKNVHFEKLQDMLSHGDYDWKGMLEFLNSYISLNLVWNRILFATSLWLQAHAFFQQIILTDVQRNQKSTLDLRYDGFLGVLL